MYSTLSPRRVTVIGGGITGLAAAHHLRELDPAIQLTVLETADRLGGALHTVQREGFLVERGPDNFITNVPPGIELCQRIGLDDDLLETDANFRRAFVVRNDKLLPIPDGFTLMSPGRLWPIITSPLLSPWGKLRLMMEFFISKRESPNEWDINFRCECDRLALIR